MQQKRTDFINTMRQIGVFFAIAGALPLGVIACVAAGPPGWYTLSIGLGVFFSELQVLFGADRKAMALLAEGLSKNLLNSLIIRELLILENINQKIEALEKLIFDEEHIQSYAKDLKEEIERIEKLKFSTEYEERCKDKIQKTYRKNRLSDVLNELQDLDLDATRKNELAENALFKDIQAIKISPTTTREHQIKMGVMIGTIIIFAVPFGVASGITFFMHALILLAFLSNPLLFTIAGVFTVFSILASGLLMTETMRAAVKSNLLFKLFDKITSLFVPKDPWNKLDKSQKAICIVKGIAIALLVLSIIALAALATMSTCGTWVGAVAGFLTFAHIASNGLALTISTYYISISVFSMLLIFTIEHCIKIMHKTADFIAHPKDSFRNFVSKLKPIKTESLWIRVTCYTIALLVGLILLLAFALHCIGDGEVSGEGLSAGDKSWMIRGFNGTVNLLNTGLKHLTNFKFSLMSFAENLTGGVNAVTDCDFARDRTLEACTEVLENTEKSLVVASKKVSEFKTNIEKNVFDFFKTRSASIPVEPSTTETRYLSQTPGVTVN